MTYELGIPLPGRITAKGKTYSGNLAFNLKGWTFEALDLDSDFIRAMQFLKPFEVVIELENGKRYEGTGSLSTLNHGMLFESDMDLEDSVERWRSSD